MISFIDLLAPLSIKGARWFDLELLGYWHWVAAMLMFAAAAWLLFGPEPKERVAKLAGFVWTRGQFCRGWLITGDTGSGKTTSGINQLAHQVFQNQPNWGGLCIDEKGVYWETLAGMARHYGREEDLIHLHIAEEQGSKRIHPVHRFNLTGDRSIPFSTYAKFVVDTATSLGQGGDKGFFKSQAQTHIAHALELLAELSLPVTLLGVFQVLSDEVQLRDELDALGDLLETSARTALIEHFEHRYLNQPSEQMGGVRETISNYLQYFITPEIAEVFCAPTSTFEFGEIDQGRIILTTMPQKFQTERRYVNTFLKLLYYQHALRRFDKPRCVRANDNLLVLWADEAQRFMTASEDGSSDYNCVDVIREAGATIVAAAQSTTSLIPPLGQDKARVLTLNLRNRIIFRSADEADAVQSADFLGKKWVVNRSWGYSGGKRSINHSMVEEYRLKPYELRTLRDHEAVLVHCEQGLRRRTLRPLESDGSVASWFPWWSL